MVSPFGSSGNRVEGEKEAPTSGQCNANLTPSNCNLVNDGEIENCDDQSTLAFIPTKTRKVLFMNSQLTVYNVGTEPCAQLTDLFGIFIERFHWNDFKDIFKRSGVDFSKIYKQNSSGVMESFDVVPLKEVTRVLVNENIALTSFGELQAKRAKMSDAHETELELNKPQNWPSSPSKAEPRSFKVGQIFLRDQPVPCCYVSQDVGLVRVVDLLNMHFFRGHLNPSRYYTEQLLTACNIARINVQLCTESQRLALVNEAYAHDSDCLEAITFDSIPVLDYYIKKALIQKQAQRRFLILIEMMRDIEANINYP